MMCNGGMLRMIIMGLNEYFSNNSSLRHCFTLNLLRITQHEHQTITIHVELPKWLMFSCSKADVTTEPSRFECMFVSQGHVRGDQGSGARACRACAVRMPAFSPLERPSYNPFGPLGGYDLGPAGQGEPVWSRLKGSVYPVLDVCMDAYYASLSKSFQGDIEFVHHVGAAVEFIHEGADVDVRDDTSGGSCLHFAAGCGSLPLCKTLLSAKARLNARDFHLQTPLWWAISGNHRNLQHFDSPYTFDLHRFCGSFWHSIPAVSCLPM